MWFYLFEAVSLEKVYFGPWYCGLSFYWRVFCLQVANGHKPDKGKQPVKAPRSKKTSHTPNDNDNTIGVSERTPTPKPDSWKDHCSDQGNKK